MNFKELSKSILKVVLPLFFGVALFWYLYRQVDMNAIWHVLKEGVKYDVLCVSLLFGAAANIIRGYRWNILIKTLGDKPRKINLICAVLGSYAINLILPRIGEFWRCGVITQYEDISYSKLFGTLVIDRLADTITVGLLVLSIFTFNIEFFSHFFADHPDLLAGFHRFIDSSWIYIIICVLAALSWIVIRYFKHVAIVARIIDIVKNIWTGIKTVWYMKEKFMFLLCTAGIWVGYFFFFYTTFYAFDFTKDLGVDIGLIAFAMSSVGVAVPVQGGIGPWHFMVISTLVCFGVTNLDASAFALIVHGVQTIWTGLIGLAAIIALPLINKKSVKSNN